MVILDNRDHQQNQERNQKTEILFQKSMMIGDARVNRKPSHVYLRALMLLKWERISG
jgi:hypothetical protein